MEAYSIKDNHLLFHPDKGEGVGKLSARVADRFYTCKHLFTSTLNQLVGKSAMSARIVNKKKDML